MRGMGCFVMARFMRDVECVNVALVVIIEEDAPFFTEMGFFIDHVRPFAVCWLVLKADFSPYL